MPTDDILNKSPIAIMELDNYISEFDINTMDWDDDFNLMNEYLKFKYQPSKIIEEGKNEYDKMLLLLKWTSNQWDHHSNNMGKIPDALAILDAVKEGEQFRCVEYSIVLAHLLTILGYPARTVGLLPYETTLSSNSHVCVEVWSNQFQKWILFDPQNNGYWKTGNEILNAMEIRELRLNNKEKDLKFIIDQNEIESSKLKETWAQYFYHLRYPISYGFLKHNYQSTASPNRVELLRNGIIPAVFVGKWIFNLQWTSEADKIYPKLNQTGISLNHTNQFKLERKFNVQLTHTMPFFDHYFIKIDQEPWKKTFDKFIWELQEGKNELQAKAVNKMGVEGKISNIVLRNNIDKPDETKTLQELFSR